MGRAVPADQAIALAKAARLLQNHNVDWPSLLTQVLHELAAKDGKPDAVPEAAQLQDVDMQGLTRFFAGFRDKEQS